MRTYTATLTIILLLLASLPVVARAAPPKTDGLTLFKVEVPQATLERIKKQAADHRWLEPQGIEGWKHAEGREAAEHL